MMCEKLKRVRNLAFAALVIIEKKYLDGEKKDNIRQLPAILCSSIKQFLNETTQSS